MTTAEALSRAPEQPSRTRRPSRRASSHDVQFYERDAFLINAVSDFFADGLLAGQRVVAIATQRHRRALSSALAKRGLDVLRVRERGQLRLLDARRTLDSFMLGDAIDSARFRGVILPMVETRSASNPKAPVRLYGEMVNVLWQDGNHAGALELESLWNVLGAECEIELLCGYAMANFGSSSDAEQFEQICHEHGRVVPAESYTRADESGRLLEISRLQQRAHALENEVARREMLECQLRDALVQQDRSLSAEREARAEAESANRAKSEFLAAMSHELRTPLNAIAGHAQLIEMGLHGPVTTAQRDALGRIAHSQQHLLTLVNDVLNLARIESGRSEFVIESVEVAPLIQSVVAMIEPLLSAAQVRCHVVLSSAASGAAPLTVRADEEKLKQILLNLLTNALKFTSPGDEISIDATRTESGVAACIEVSDTGIGIPPDKLETIFEPFTQLATKLSARHGGIGLGLTISRQFARGMHGDLVAASGITRGACFRLTLPLAPPLAE